MRVLSQMRSSRLYLSETPQNSIDFFSSQYLIQYNFILEGQQNNRIACPLYKNVISREQLHAFKGM